MQDYWPKAKRAIDGLLDRPCDKTN